MTFNEQCYALLKQIPKGKVTTYKAIADALNTKAYQAVGNAMNQNPTPFIVPCHRVVKSNGEVGGFALGEAMKTELLEQEGIQIKDGKVCELEKVLHIFDKPYLK